LTRGQEVMVEVDQQEQGPVDVGMSAVRDRRLASLESIEDVDVQPGDIPALEAMSARGAVPRQQALLFRVHASYAPLSK
jgi:hypothetical protein